MVGLVMRPYNKRPEGLVCLLQKGQFENGHLQA